MSLQGDTIRKEPAAIIDITGSFIDPVMSGSMLSKAALTEQIMRILVHDLGSEDSQAADEKDGGGLLTVSFADGVANEVGDLNDANFDQKWHRIRWSGGTYITPAFEMVEENFKEEFGHRDLHSIYYKRSNKMLLRKYFLKAQSEPIRCYAACFCPSARMLIAAL